MDLLNKLNIKISEHNTELQGSLQELSNFDVLKKDPVMASKYLVIKDKVLFHKTAILVLEDLKKELCNE